MRKGFVLPLTSFLVLTSASAFALEADINIAYLRGAVPDSFHGAAGRAELKTNFCAFGGGVRVFDLTYCFYWPGNSYKWEAYAYKPFFNKNGLSLTVGVIGTYYDWPYRGVDLCIWPNPTYDERAFLFGVPVTAIAEDGRHLFRPGVTTYYKAYGAVAGILEQDLLIEFSALYRFRFSGHLSAEGKFEYTRGLYPNLHFNEIPHKDELLFFEVGPVFSF